MAREEHVNESVFGRIATYRGELWTPHKYVGHLTEVAPGFLEVSCSTNKNSKLLLLGISSSSSNTFPFFFFSFLFYLKNLKQVTGFWFFSFFLFFYSFTFVSVGGQVGLWATGFTGSPVSCLSHKPGLLTY